MVVHPLGGTLTHSPCSPALSYPVLSGEREGEGGGGGEEEEEEEEEGGEEGEVEEEKEAEIEVGEKGEERICVLFVFLMLLILSIHTVH